jgi:hypothetical protein
MSSTPRNLFKDIFNLVKESINLLARKIHSESREIGRIQEICTYKGLKKDLQRFWRL